MFIIIKLDRARAYFYDQSRTAPYTHANPGAGCIIVRRKSNRTATNPTMSASQSANTSLPTISRRDIMRRGLCIALLWCLAGPAKAQTKKPRVFDLELRRGRVAVAQRTVRVKQGERVELRWTTDAAVQLHLHGYDIDLALTPGKTRSMVFDAHTAGRYPVRRHGSGHRSVLYLEVHPR